MREEKPPQNPEREPLMSKTLATLATSGLIVAGAVAFGFAQAAQADDGTTSAKSIVAQAEAIGEDVEAQCQLPLRDAAERATADPAALSDLEAANQRCLEIGQQYAYFVEIVTKHADAVAASVPEEAREAAEAAMAAVTPEVKAQVEADDVEGAVRTLFQAVAPQFEIESEVGQ
ncbi:hypothetical protein AB1K56_03380 [Microbacterium sp. BWR-S6Y]|uniref:hypothetical protein n=1 Tax=Microbacterium sp. BWR-S6Y TaxID=3232073 RepID=UPI003527D980